MMRDSRLAWERASRGHGGTMLNALRKVLLFPLVALVVCYVMLRLSWAAAVTMTREYWHDG